MQFDQSNDTSAPVASIRVIGVGGGGGNAINRMISAKIKSAQFIAINTDKKSLMISKAETRIQIGIKLTDGLGAGADPNIGRGAAEESKAAITDALKGADMVFITAGMGGGTGTGAAPVVAAIAKELGALTIGVVTKPFEFEGARRMKNAEVGIANLRPYVDTLIVVPNEKLHEVFPEASLVDSFKYADNVLRQAIQGISEIISRNSTINVDFADVRTIMAGQGIAHMGIGEGTGDNRMMTAIQSAVYSPLLSTNIEGAKNVLLYVEGGEGLGLGEVKKSAGLVRDVVHPGANIIFGANIDESLGDTVVVTVVATGIADGGESADDTVIDADRYAKILEERLKGHINTNRPPITPQAPQKSIEEEYEEYSKQEHEYAKPEYDAPAPSYNPPPQPSFTPPTYTSQASPTYTPPVQSYQDTRQEQQKSNLPRFLQKLFPKKPDEE